MRVADIGDIPARFIMLEVTHGEPIANDERLVEVYGMHYRGMDAVLGDGQTQLLLEKSH